MEVTLQTKDHIWSEPNKKGKRKLLKRNVITKITVDINDIITIGELVDESGKLLKDYSRIHIKEAGPMIVNHSVDYLKKIKGSIRTQIGFKQKLKIKK